MSPLTNLRVRAVISIKHPNALGEQSDIFARTQSLSLKCTDSFGFLHEYIK